MAEQNLLSQVEIASSSFVTKETVSLYRSSNLYLDSDIIYAALPYEAEVDFNCKAKIMIGPDLLSTAQIPEVNALTIGYSVPYGESDLDLSSKGYIPIRKDLISTFGIKQEDLEDMDSTACIHITDDMSSTAFITYRVDLNSQVILPDYTQLYLQWKVAQIPLFTDYNYPVKDSFTAKAKPYLNYGEYGSLETGTDQRTFMVFSLKGIKDLIDKGEQIWTITLELSMDSVLDKDVKFDFLDYPDDWLEYDITWQNQEKQGKVHLTKDKYLDSTKVVLDVKDYILALIESLDKSGEDLLWSFELKTSYPLVFSSKESPHPPVLKIEHRDPNWSGLLGESDLLGTVVIRREDLKDLTSFGRIYWGQAFDGTVELEQIPIDIDSKVIISSDKGSEYLPGTVEILPLVEELPGEAIIACAGTEDLHSTVELKPRESDLESTVGIPTGDESLLPSSVFIPHKDLISEVVVDPRYSDLDGRVEICLGYIRNADLSGTVNIVEYTWSDFNGIAHIPTLDLISKAEIYNGQTELPGQVYILIGGETDLGGAVLLERAYKDLISSTSIAFSGDKDLTGQIQFIGGDLPSKVDIYNGLSELPSKVVVKSDIIDADFNGKVEITSPDLRGQVFVPYTDDLPSKAFIVLHDDNDLAGSAYIVNSYIDSVVDIQISEDMPSQGSIYFNEDLSGTGLIRRDADSDLDSIISVTLGLDIGGETFIAERKDLDGTAIICVEKSEDLPSEAIIRQAAAEDLPSEVKLEVYIHEYLDSKVTIVSAGYADLDGIAQLVQAGFEELDSTVRIIGFGYGFITLDTTPPIEFEAMLDKSILTETNNKVKIKCKVKDTDKTILEVKFKGVGFSVLNGTTKYDDWYYYQEEFILEVTTGFFFLDVYCRDDVWNMSPNIPHFEFLYPDGEISSSAELELDTTAPSGTITINDGSGFIYNHFLEFNFTGFDTDTLDLKIWGDFLSTEISFKNVKVLSKWLDFKPLIKACSTTGLGVKNFHIAIRDDVWNEREISISVEFVPLKFTVVEENQVVEIPDIISSFYDSAEVLESSVEETFWKDSGKHRAIFNKQFNTFEFPKGNSFVVLSLLVDYISRLIDSVELVVEGRDEDNFYDRLKMKYSEFFEHYGSVESEKVNLLGDDSALFIGESQLNLLSKDIIYPWDALYEKNFDTFDSYKGQDFSKVLIPSSDLSSSEEVAMLLSQLVDCGTVGSFVNIDRLFTVYESLKSCFTLMVYAGNIPERDVIWPWESDYPYSWHNVYPNPNYVEAFYPPGVFPGETAYTKSLYPFTKDDCRYGITIGSQQTILNTIFDVYKLEGTSEYETEGTKLVRKNKVSFNLRDYDNITDYTYNGELWTQCENIVTPHKFRLTLDKSLLFNSLNENANGLFVIQNGTTIFSSGSIKDRLYENESVIGGVINSDLSSQRFSFDFKINPKDGSVIQIIFDTVVTAETDHIWRAANFEILTMQPLSSQNIYIDNSDEYKNYYATLRKRNPEFIEEVYADALLPIVTDFYEDEFDLKLYHSSECGDIWDDPGTTDLDKWAKLYANNVGDTNLYLYIVGDSSQIDEVPLISVTLDQEVETEERFYDVMRIFTRYEDISSCFKTLVYSLGFIDRLMIFPEDSAYDINKYKNPKWGKPILPSDADYPYKSGEALSGTQIEFKTVIYNGGNILAGYGAYSSDGWTNTGVSKTISYVKDLTNATYDYAISCMLRFAGEGPYIGDFTASLYEIKANGSEILLDSYTYNMYVIADDVIWEVNNGIRVAKEFKLSKGKKYSVVLSAVTQECFDGSNNRIETQYKCWLVDEDIIDVNPEYIKYREEYLFGDNPSPKFLDFYEDLFEMKIFNNSSCGDYLWTYKTDDPYERWVHTAINKDRITDIEFKVSGEEYAVDYDEFIRISLNQEMNLSTNSSFESNILLMDVAAVCKNLLIYYNGLEGREYILPREEGFRGEQITNPLWTKTIVPSDPDYPFHPWDEQYGTSIPYSWNRNGVRFNTTGYTLDNYNYIVEHDATVDDGKPATYRVYEHTSNHWATREIWSGWESYGNWYNDPFWEWPSSDTIVKIWHVVSTKYPVDLEFINLRFSYVKARIYFTNGSITREFDIDSHALGSHLLWRIIPSDVLVPGDITIRLELYDYELTVPYSPYINDLYWLPSHGFLGNKRFYVFFGSETDTLYNSFYPLVRKQYLQVYGDYLPRMTDFYEDLFEMKIYSSSTCNYVHWDIETDDRFEKYVYWIVNTDRYRDMFDFKVPHDLMFKVVGQEQWIVEEELLRLTLNFSLSGEEILNFLSHGVFVGESIYGCESVLTYTENLFGRDDIIYPWDNAYPKHKLEYSIIPYGEDVGVGHSMYPFKIEDRFFGHIFRAPIGFIGPFYGQSRVVLRTPYVAFPSDDDWTTFTTKLAEPTDKAALGYNWNAIGASGERRLVTVHDYYTGDSIGEKVVPLQQIFIPFTLSLSVASTPEPSNSYIYWQIWQKDTETEVKTLLNSGYKLEKSENDPDIQWVHRQVVWDLEIDPINGDELIIQIRFTQASSHQSSSEIKPTDRLLWNYGISFKGEKGKVVHSDDTCLEEFTQWYSLDNYEGYPLPAQRLAGGDILFKDTYEDIFTFDIYASNPCGSIIDQNYTDDFDRWVRLYVWNKPYVNNHWIIEGTFLYDSDNLSVELPIVEDVDLTVIIYSWGERFLFDSGDSCSSILIYGEDDNRDFEKRTPFNLDNHRWESFAEGLSKKKLYLNAGCNKHDFAQSNYKNNYEEFVFNFIKGENYLDLEFLVEGEAPCQEDLELIRIPTSEDVKPDIWFYYDKDLFLSEDISPCIGILIYTLDDSEDNWIKVGNGGNLIKRDFYEPLFDYKVFLSSNCPVNDWSIGESGFYYDWLKQRIKHQYYVNESYLFVGQFGEALSEAEEVLASKDINTLKDNLVDFRPDQMIFLKQSGIANFGLVMHLLDEDVEKFSDSSSISLPWYDCGELTSKLELKVLLRLKLGINVDTMMCISLDEIDFGELSEDLVVDLFMDIIIRAESKTSILALLPLNLDLTAEIPLCIELNDTEVGDSQEEEIVDLFWSEVVLSGERIWADALIPLYIDIESRDFIIFDLLIEDFGDLEEESLIDLPLVENFSFNERIWADTTILLFIDVHAHISDFMEVIEEDYGSISEDETIKISLISDLKLDFLLRPDVILPISDKGILYESNMLISLLDEDLMTSFEQSQVILDLSEEVEVDFRVTMLVTLDVSAVYGSYASALINIPEIDDGYFQEEEILLVATTAVFEVEEKLDSEDKSDSDSGKYSDKDYLWIPEEDTCFGLDEEIIELASVAEGEVDEKAIIDKDLYLFEEGHVCFWIQIERYEEPPIWVWILYGLTPPKERLTLPLDPTKVYDVLFTRKASCAGSPPGGWPPIRPWPVPPGYIIIGGIPVPNPNDPPKGWIPDPENPPKGWIPPSGPGGKWEPDPKEPPDPEDPKGWLPDPNDPPKGWIPGEGGGLIPDPNDPPKGWIPGEGGGLIPDPNDPPKGWIPLPPGELGEPGGWIPDPTDPPKGWIPHPGRPGCEILDPDLTELPMSPGDVDYPLEEGDSLYGKVIPKYLDKETKSEIIEGGVGVTVNTHKFENIKSVIKLTWDMEELPDRLYVTYNKKRIFDTGILKGAGSVEFEWEPTEIDDDFISVLVVGLNWETKWKYGVHQIFGEVLNPEWTRDDSPVSDEECWDGPDGPVKPGEPLEPDPPEPPDKPPIIPGEYPEPEPVPGDEVSFDKLIAIYKPLKLNLPMIITIPEEDEDKVWESHYYALDLILEIDDIKIHLLDGFEIDVEEPFRFGESEIDYRLEQPLDISLSEAQVIECPSEIDFNLEGVIIEEKSDILNMDLTTVKTSSEKISFDFSLTEGDELL